MYKPKKLVSCTTCVRVHLGHLCLDVLGPYGIKRYHDGLTGFISVRVVPM